MSYRVVYKPKHLDDKGRCCGRKPLVYKRGRYLFCCRCDAAFNVDTGLQMANWAFKAERGGFVFSHPHMEEERFAAGTLPESAPEAGL